MLCKSCLFRLFAKIAELLTELGAEHSEDVLHYDVSIGNWGRRPSNNIYISLAKSMRFVYKHVMKAGIKEAARLIGVSIDTLKRWKKVGKMNSYRISGDNGTRSHKNKNKKIMETLRQVADDICC